MPSLPPPNCVFGVPFNGGTLPDNMGVFELEDSALMALHKPRMPSRPARPRGHHPPARRGVRPGGSPADYNQAVKAAQAAPIP